ncbi:MAG: LamG-like jellyroll fold domain-containing protein [Candidatus Paceibacterota bacterium]
MFKRGFTLIEILLVVGIAAGIFLLSAPYSLKFYQTQLVEEARNNLADTIQRARHNAILQKGDTDLGVSLADANGYTLFRGSAYNNPSDSDEVYTWTNGITIDTSNFGDSDEIVFSKLTGQPSATGTITINFGDISRHIFLADSGSVVKTATSTAENQSDTVPGVPTSVSAVAGNASATITFSAPADDGGSAITSYTVTSSPGNFFSTGASSPIVVSGLTNTTSYTFTVTATNAIGTSDSSSASNSITPTSIPSSGLIAYWSFNGNANESIASKNGTVVGGASLTTGVKGLSNTAYSFGTGKYINISQTIGTIKTISVWFYNSQILTASSGGKGIIETNYSIGGGGYSGITAGDVTGYLTNEIISIAMPSSNIKYGWCDAAGSVAVGWHHLVVNFNVASHDIYLDNVQINNCSNDAATSNFGTFMTTIGFMDSGTYYWGGSLDEVRVYNRALTTDEISNIYNEEKP